MKRFYYIILLILGLGLLPAEDTAVSLSWHTEEALAKADAKKQGKPLFLFFTADWCHYCHLMEDETLNKPEVSQYLSENFVLLKVDYDTSKDLVARYRVRGVPAMVIGDPDLEKVEQTSGFMPLDVFTAWAEMAATNVSPKAIAAAKEADRKYIIDTSRSFRQGLTEDQYASINLFYENVAKRDAQALEFAKNHLTEEIEHNPGRFCRFLKNKKLHVRILTTNAFSKLYGTDFTYDPWDLSKPNYAVLDSFLEEHEISSLLEDLINF